MIKTLKVSIYLLFSIHSIECFSQIGYNDLDKLYSDFVIVLKNSNQNNLITYCYNVTPDNGTLEYMKKHNFSYRGIPQELEEQNIDPSQIGETYYEAVSRFKSILVENNQLKDLTYLGREKYGEELFDKKLDIYVTETFILLESKGDTIRYKMGEMFKINGIWKSFTSPKIRW